MSDALPAQVSPQRILQMIWAFAAPLTLEAAVHVHRVFDTLDERPKTLEEIARETKARFRKRGLKAILNTLVSFEILGKDGDRFKLVPESAAFLVSHKPAYQGAILRHISSQLIPGWLKLSGNRRHRKSPAASVNQEFHRRRVFSPISWRPSPSLSRRPGKCAGGEHLFANLQSPASVLDLAARSSGGVRALRWPNGRHRST